jgi:hypothetical protein
MRKLVPPYPSSDLLRRERMEVEDIVSYHDLVSAEKAALQKGDERPSGKFSLGIGLATFSTVGWNPVNITVQAKTFLSQTMRPGRTEKLICLALLIFVAGCTAIPTSLNPTAIPLQYQMVASPGEFPNVPACAALSGVQVSDARLDKTIGKRYVETNPSITAPVTASSDVAEWVKAGASAAAQRVGISQKIGAPVLRLSVRQIITSENVARRSGYEGRIVLSAELVRRGGGVCWQDRTEGASENYGYSGATDNYQETLNHALDRAMIRLLGDPGFQKSICSCGR